jgi:RHS repeat-associated protein
MPYRYVGAYGVRWDTDTALAYMRQRWYNCTLHRFVSRDSKSNLRIYSYARNTPTNFIDPSGLEAIVYFIDGTSLSTTSGYALSKAIQLSAPETITGIVINGHGTPTSTSLSVEENQGSTIDLVSNNRNSGVYIEARINGKNTIVNLADILRTKLADNAYIYINACDTADFDYHGEYIQNNISQQLSSDLPNVLVRGVQGTLTEESHWYGEYNIWWQPVYGYYRDGEYIP